MKARQMAGIAGIFLATGILPSDAQPVARLPLLEVQPIPRDGTYAAGDKLEFELDHQGDQVRLRFSGSDEVFYLISEAAPLGDRVLKYDTGDPALRVTGWGGVTLYTPDAKTGVPAEYSDVIGNLNPPPVAARDVKRFAAGLAKEVDTHADIAVGFAADWDELSRSEPVRILACDAMRNASYALEQQATGAGRNSLSEAVHVVHILEGNSASAVVHRGILTVTIVPKLGPSARPSSLTISRALEAAFSSAVKG